MLIAGYNESVKKKEKERLHQEMLIERQRVETERIAQERILEKERMERQKEQEELERKLTQEQIDSIRNKIDFPFALKEISENHRNFLLGKLNSEWWIEYDFDKMIENCKSLLRHESLLTNKYGTEVAQKLIYQQYWIGMTQEQLLDCKGNPDKIEIEALKTKTKEIYIYGNKSSGDYFVFENKTVTKFVDR